MNGVVRAAQYWKKGLNILVYVFLYQSSQVNGPAKLRMD